MQLTGYIFPVNTRDFNGQWQCMHILILQQSESEQVKKSVILILKIKGGDFNISECIAKDHCVYFFFP